MDYPPKICVICTAAYNKGLLYGKWIDPTQDSDDIYKEITDLLAESPIENVGEYAIHDYSGFGDVTVEKYTIEYIVYLARFIANHGELGLALLRKYSLRYAEVLLRDHYEGAYESVDEYETIVFGECYHAVTNVVISGSLIRYYIREGFFPQLRAKNYFSVEAQGQIHIFK